MKKFLLEPTSFERIIMTNRFTKQFGTIKKLCKKRMDEKSILTLLPIGTKIKLIIRIQKLSTQS